MTATKLIELDDGTLIEVEVPEDQAQQISNRFADKVNTTFDKIKPILVKSCRTITAAWKEINQEMQIEKAEVEINFNFEAEGNVYVSKAKAGSHFKVKLVLNPKSQP